MRIIAMVMLAASFVACGDESVCSAGEVACEGMQIMTCGDDGQFGAAADCPEVGQQCMTMGGTPHCMAPAN
jgi:hypothetical protein